MTVTEKTTLKGVLWLINDWIWTTVYQRKTKINSRNTIERTGRCICGRWLKYPFRKCRETLFSPRRTTQWLTLSNRLRTTPTASQWCSQKSLVHRSYTAPTSQSLNRTIAWVVRFCLSRCTNSDICQLTTSMPNRPLIHTNRTRRCFYASMTPRRTTRRLSSTKRITRLRILGIPAIRAPSFPMTTALI